MSSQHVAALRDFVGGNVTNAALRKVLVRAAGNLDRAAELLLSESTVARDEAAAPKPTAAPAPKVAEAVGPSAETLPSAQVPMQPPLPNDVRKLAWKRFWKERFLTAKQELGAMAQKSAINVRIAELWRDLEWTGRDRLYAAARDELQQQNACNGGAAASSPVTPLEKSKSRSADRDITLREKKTKVMRADNAKDVSTNRAQKDQTDRTGPVRIDDEDDRVGDATHARGDDELGTDSTIPEKSRADMAPGAQTAFGSFVRETATADAVDVDAIVVDIDGEDKTYGDGQLCDIVTTYTEPAETSWPRLIASRILRGTMTVSGMNVVKAGQSVVLCPSNNNIVRFSLRDREIGRLPSSLARFLAPALASGFVEAAARVVEAPKVCRPLSEIYIDISILVRHRVFQPLSALNLPAAEGPSSGKRNLLKDKKSRKGTGKGKKANGNYMEENEGIDVGRLSVESLMVHLEACEPASASEKDASLAIKAPELIRVGPESYLDAVHTINFPAENNDYQHPKQLSCKLRDYQKVGVLWMRSRELYGNSSKDGAAKIDATDAWVHPLWRRRAFPGGDTFYSNRATGGFCLEPPVALQEGPYGGILADEMGLGKTVMSIAVMIMDRVHLDAALGADFTSEKNVGKNVLDVEVVAVDDESDAELQRDEDEGREDEAAREANGGGGVQSEERCETENDEMEHDVVVDTGGSDGVESDGDDDDDWSGEEDGDSSDSDFVPDRRVARGRKPPTATSGKVGKRRKHATQSDEPPDTSWVRKAQFAKHTGSVYSRVHKLRTKEKTGKCKKKLQGGTLLVVPMSLIGQWRSELEKHVEKGFFRCKTHHEQRGGAAGVSVAVADVVLTTYGIVSSEAPRFGSDGKLAKDGGPLFDVEWRRVILDEAHSIKNKTTKSAKACFQLCAERKWCLTGSPVQNEVSDCQPLLRFLQVHPWSSWGFWQRGVLSKIESPDAKTKAEGYATLRSILSPITLRRLKSTVGSDGKPLVQMVERVEEIVQLTPGERERAFYETLHTKSKSKFDTYVAQGKVLNQWANVLELLLRLRQACCHPWLVFAASQADAKVSDDRESMYRMFAAGGSAAFAEQAVAAAQSRKGADGEGDAASAAAAAASQPCPICLSDMEDATALKRCGHAGCRDCLLRMLEVRGGGAAGACPVCRAPVEGKADLVRLPRGDGSSARFPMDIRKNWVSSAKLDYIVGEVRRMSAARRSAASGAVGKTVIMSQFTSFLDLVGAALEREGARYERFDGTLSARRRAEVLGRFAEDDERDAATAQVLLVSLRAGNVGLNLVSASLCVLCDPSWNPMVDAQAAARVHRHGQTRKVTIKRLVVAGSVEDRLLLVQDRKRDMTEGALATASREDKALRVEKMKMLFAR